MRLSEARAEAERYLAHLDAQKKKADALLKIAADRRAGRCDAKEGERRRSALQGHSPTVFDGSMLAEAVRVFLKVTKEEG